MNSSRHGLVRVTSTALIGVLSWSALATAAWASNGSPSEAGGFQRPHPDAIRAELHQILADPQYAPSKTVWQWVWDKLAGWRWPDVHWGGAWAKPLATLLLIWCLLALAAVLAHLLWTVAVLIGQISPGSVVGSHRRHRRAAGASYEQLCVEMRRLAETGAYREAISVMMIALLRWLDAIHVLHYHESKTNGDYVSEFAPASPGRDEFRQFVVSFDESVYGRAPCGPQVYEQLDSVFQRIRNHVNERPQV